MSIQPLKNNLLVPTSSNINMIFLVPTELIKEIFHLLTNRTLCQCLLVCKAWNKIGNQVFCRKIAHRLGLQINEEQSQSLSRLINHLFQKVDQNLQKDISFESFKVLYASLPREQLGKEYLKYLTELKSNISKFAFLYNFKKDCNFIKKIIKKFSNNDALFDSKLIEDLNLIDLLIKERAFEQLKEIYIEQNKIRNLIEKKLEHKFKCFIFLFRKAL